jgi:hypothetical protein
MLPSNLVHLNPGPDRQGVLTASKRLIALAVRAIVTTFKALDTSKHFSQCTFLVDMPDNRTRPAKDRTCCAAIPWLKNFLAAITCLTFRKRFLHLRHEPTVVIEADPRRPGLTEPAPVVAADFEGQVIVGHR